MTSWKPKRTTGSHRREILEPEEFIAKMNERRKDRVLYLAIILDLLFMIVVIFQAFGYANLSSKTLYAIVASLLATTAYVIRATFK